MEQARRPDLLTLARLSVQLDLVVYPCYPSTGEVEAIPWLLLTAQLNLEDEPQVWWETLSPNIR